MVEANAVSPEGRTSPEDAGIWTDEQAHAWSRIVQFAHSQGQKIGIQLDHAGRKASTLPPFVAAVRAGFDVIDLHGAHGFLIGSFLSPQSNRRTDEYGGSIPNRARFALEVIDAIVAAVGPKKTSIRLSPWSRYQGQC